MAKLNVFKETSLPGTLAPNSLYLILNGDYCESYVSNSAGVGKLVGNTTMINELITAAGAGTATNELEIVADITARDALSLAQNTLVLVEDASADATVDSGAALYIYKQSTDTYSKLTEYESLDVIVNWTDIVGRPNKTKLEIEQAVDASHTHANKPQIDKVGEDGDGDITYGGEPVMQTKTTNW